MDGGYIASDSESSDSSAGGVPRMSPDRAAPTRQRKAWRFLSTLGCILGATSLLVTALKWTGTDQRQDHQALVSQQAICALVVYAEQQADALKYRNPPAAENLEKLAADMRGTGIHCPPRKHVNTP